MNRRRRIAADLAGRAVAALVWTLVIVATVLLALVVGAFLVVRHIGRVLLAWPAPVESRSDREARLLDPHRPWLDADYDMDAELAQLVAEEKRRFPADGGSVRGWLAISAALVGIAICAVVSFVVFAIQGGAF